jgi:hypothetical protein
MKASFRRSRFSGGVRNLARTTTKFLELNVLELNDVSRELSASISWRLKNNRDRSLHCDWLAIEQTRTITPLAHRGHRGRT